MWKAEEEKPAPRFQVTLEVEFRPDDGPIQEETVAKMMQQVVDKGSSAHFTVGRITPTSCKITEVTNKK